MADTEDLGELSVKLTAIDASFKASMKEVSAALDKVAVKMEDLPTDKVNKNFLSMRSAMRSMTTGMREGNEAFDLFTGKATLSVHSLMGFAHLIPAMASPLGALITGLGFAAAASFRFAKANKEIDAADAKAALGDIDQAARNAAAGWDAYYAAIASGKSGAEAALSQSLGGAMSQLGADKSEADAAIKATSAAKDALVEHRKELVADRDALQARINTLQEQKYLDDGAKIQLGVMKTSLAEYNTLIDENASKTAGDDRAIQNWNKSQGDAANKAKAATEALEELRRAHENSAKDIALHFKKAELGGSSHTTTTELLDLQDQYDRLKSRMEDLARKGKPFDGMQKDADALLKKIQDLQAQYDALDTDWSTAPDDFASQFALTPGTNWNEPGTGQGGGATSGQSLSGAIGGAGGPAAAGGIMMGGIGGTAGNVVSGFQAGGPLGALAGLLVSSKGFGQVIEKLNAVLQPIADGLGKVFTPLLPVIGTLGLIVRTELLPVFWVLGLEGKAVAWVFKEIFDVIKIVMVGLLKAVQKFAHALHLHVSGLSAALAAWENATYANIGAMNNMTSASANVPQGFKQAMYEFQSMTGTGGGGGSHGSTAGGLGTLGTPAGATLESATNGGMIVHIGTVQVGNPDEFVRKLEDIQRRKNYRMTGSTQPVLPRFMSRR